MMSLLFFCAPAVSADQAPDPNEKKPFFSLTPPASGEVNTPAAPDGTISDALHRMMLAVLIVVVLGAAAMYAGRKVLPKLGHMQGRKIKVVETVHLGSRKAIHLLDIDGRQILIGSTPDTITRLAEIGTVFSAGDFTDDDVDFGDAK